MFQRLSLLLALAVAAGCTSPTDATDTTDFPVVLESPDSSESITVEVSAARPEIRYYEISDT